MKLLFKLRIPFILMALTLLVAPFSAPAMAQPSQQAQNLLNNPGFDDPYSQLYPAIIVANGWTPWWVQPDSSESFPGYCDYRVKPPSCQPYAVPEFKGAAPFSERIRSGNNSQQWFKTWSIFLAGVYQQVTGVVPGQTYQFNAYMMSWSNNGADNYSSAGQPSMGLQLGIDPNGGTDPFSPSIVFSQSQNAFDQWYLLSVETVAKSSTITVFVRSWPALALKDINVYLDDASLYAIGPAAPAPTNPAIVGPVPEVTFAAPPSGVFVESTPLPNGEVWYTVQSGDTLGGIAYRHDTTVDAIKQLNNLTSNLIKVNDKLLVKVVTVEPTATPLPPPTDPPTLAPTVAQSPTFTAIPVALSSDYGQLCVVAYNDLNKNATNEDEPGVPDVEVTLNVGNTPLDGYVTTSTESDHCFPQLPPGSYTISVSSPAGFLPTTANQATVNLQAGNLVTLAFGLASTTDSSAAPKTVEPGGSEMTLLWAGVGLVTISMLGVAGWALMLARKK